MEDIVDTLESALFIPSEEWEEFQAKQQEVLSSVAHGTSPLPSLRKEFSRADVVASFQTAFEAVGGTTRLALYANEHYSDFIKLYARLLPSQASSALGESTDIRIIHKLPRSELDA
jgi:hypothetical protein